MDSPSMAELRRLAARTKVHCQDAVMTAFIDAVVAKLDDIVSSYNSHRHHYESSDYDAGAIRYIHKID